MRNHIVAGNWKMNLDLTEAKKLAEDLVEQAKNIQNDENSDLNCTLVVAPPFLYQSELVRIFDGSILEVGAQNCSNEVSGAYTGEVAVPMIKSVGTTYIIIGHSERRAYFSEGSEQLAQKVDLSLEYGLTPIFCCGEPLDIRENETHVDYVSKQIEDGLFHLNKETIEKVVIAYEPIWAIGTGVTASSQQAQDMHKSLRDALAQKYGKEIAENISILYGGSCKPSNAKELFACPDVDGGLIGGASLNASDFLTIAKSF